MPTVVVVVVGLPLVMQPLAVLPVPHSSTTSTDEKHRRNEKHNEEKEEEEQQEEEEEKGQKDTMA